jgi:hypothetical protein
VPVALSKADYAELTFGTQINGYTEHFTQRKYTKSWCPIEGKENNRTKLIEKLFPGKDLVFANKLLHAAWARLTNTDDKIVYYDGKLVNTYFYLIRL